MNISAASYIEKETRRESRQQQEQARQHNNNTRRNEGNNNNGNRRPTRDGRSNTRQDGKLSLKCIIVFLKWVRVEYHIKNKQYQMHVF